MAFDGSYPSQSRLAGVVHRIFVRRIFVRRARYQACGADETPLPDFVLHCRLDSTTAVGAAVLAHGALLWPAFS